MILRNRLIRPGLIALRSLLDEAKGDLARLHFEHRCRMADRDREVAALRAELEALKAVVRARQHAEAELAALYREREIQRAQATERDLCQPLN